MYHGQIHILSNIHLKGKPGKKDQNLLISLGYGEAADIRTFDFLWPFFSIHDVIFFGNQQSGDLKFIV